MTAKASRANKKPGKTDRNRAALLRSLPAIDECVRVARLTREFQGISHAYLKSILERSVAKQREAILDGASDVPAQREAMIAAAIDDARRYLKSDLPPLRPVVNATGTVLHTNLGRAILAESAIEAIERAARAPVNLEFNLETGGRGDRDSLVARDLCKLTGAEAATVVNNNAAAVLLVLNSLALGKEAIVSRGELIEIGGSFRIPDVMERSGTRLREVGTTNRTHIRDYEDAIGSETALLMKVHPSNYRLIGFTAEVSLSALVDLGRSRGIPVVEDLGSGALIDLGAYGLPREPVVADRISAGADLVTFSGDKLLGGPQAGIIVGRRDLIERLKRNPLKRALRCDKLTLAALSATLRLYLRSGDLAAELPTLRMLTRPRAEIEAMAHRARDIVVQRLGPAFTIEIVDSPSQVGSGAQPTEDIPSVALRITHRTISPEQIARMFREASVPVLGRISDDAFHLDLRTIEDPADLAVELGPRHGG
ncbi:MAG TPA: L-seryl-tRNA(Sec) selenium transferase [Candidatus Binataceae bacterium]|nr:L-seryl-tRNA(Sec) selenium transferase [Candidatus Binataceae bacterium]